ncbi:MAG TPA: hypothetical protein VM142_00260 [Acidimicrobiales bacterium]|nr:hypothetical protein [Acidimicrobiales bacterium]
MSVTDNQLVEGTGRARLREAASKTFEHIGVQLATVFDNWKDNGAGDDELAWCAYLLTFTGWWSGYLQAAADVVNRRSYPPAGW